MPEKSKNDVSLFRKYVAETAMILALAWFVVGLIYGVLMWVVDYPARIYWLYMFFNKTGGSLGCIIPLLTIPVLAAAGIFRYRTAIYRWTVFLMMAASVMFFCTSLSGGFGYYLRLADVLAGSYVYRADLEEWRVPGGTKGRVYLLRCDSLSLICERIFSQRYDPMHYYTTHTQLQVGLTVEQGKVMLFMEGEIVYAEQP